ncbi:hypothetical protein CJ030_MR6G013348 [Morella rubra]|uniref:Uncharacterized protein n=1 Tax=Morella rubra TaxID=262757 RepID=A0A6A1VEK8_9ROSI|nr:hypothetical protein CJ030_MR6G013348 [Morella rubra]
MTILAPALIPVPTFPTPSPFLFHHCRDLNFHPTCSIGGLIPSCTCRPLVGIIVTHFSISMFGDSKTSFQGISALAKSCEPRILPRTGTLFLHRSSKTTFSCLRSFTVSSVPKQSNEKDSFQERSDLEEISRLLSWILLSFPAER